MARTCSSPRPATWVLTSSLALASLRLGHSAAGPGRSPRRSGDGYGPVGVDEGPVASFHLRAAGWSRAERTASVPLLVPVTFLGEDQDVSDPDTAVLAVGKAAELQHAVGQEAVHELAAHA